MSGSGPSIPTYKVTTINLGNQRVDHSLMVSERGFGQAVDMPAWTAAIEGNGKRILVDTGIADPAWVEKVMVPCWLEDHERFDRALGDLGWSPSSVDIVINTHFHHDHCANNKLLPNAQFYATAKEWEYAQAPIEPQRVNYSHHYWEQEPLSIFNYVLIGTDYFQIAPGLMTFFTPGHTPGHQSVLVNTDEGKLCVTGDAVAFRQSFAEHRCSAIIVSVKEAMESLDKIRTLADRVLMNHDPLLVQHQSSGFPSILEMEGSPLGDGSQAGEAPTD
jgi:N-acyl homoserine lactone hydrolase